MKDCLKHKKDIAGITDMKALAEMIGDLHYYSLTELLDHLSNKIYNDGQKDFINGKTDLGHELFMVSDRINEAYKYMEAAWQISKPFMMPNEPNVKVSDTTGDDQGTKAGKQKIIIWIKK